MQRFFTPVGLSDYQKMCEQSAIWQILYAWINDPDPEVRFWNYDKDLANIRLTEFQNICRLGSYPDSNHFEELLREVVELLREEKTEKNVWKKNVLWKKIAEKWMHLEDFTSFSLLQAALKAATIKSSDEAMKVLYGMHQLYQTQEEIIAKQKELFKNPTLTYCLTNKSFNKLGELYPNLINEILADHSAYTFIANNPTLLEQAKTMNVNSMTI